MKLSETQIRFLRETNETNTQRCRGAEYTVGRYVADFMTGTITSLDLKGLIRVGTDHFATNGVRDGVSDVWVTSAGMEALRNA